MQNRLPFRVALSATLAFDTAVDNVRFSIADVGTTTTPEPSTIAPLAGGLAAIGAAARRRPRRD